jgi:hypothetical protein
VAVVMAVAVAAVVVAMVAAVAVVTVAAPLNPRAEVCADLCLGPIHGHFVFCYIFGFKS